MSREHIARTQPGHLTTELTRGLRDTTPATITRGPTATTPAGASTVDADSQLWALNQDPARALRGVPVIGAGPGAVHNTQPERTTITSLSRLERLALLFLTDAPHGTVASSA